MIYFLRHAEAETTAGSDRARRLTAKGLEQAEKVGEFCRSSGLLPALIVTSPVVRARQTAAIVAGTLGVELVEKDWLACGMSPATCLHELAHLRGDIMLVGHEPDFSAAIASLVGLHDPGAIRIRKASLTAVEISDFARGTGGLQFSIPARLM